MSKRSSGAALESRARERVAKSERVVVKVGTRVLVSDTGRPQTAKLKTLVATLASLHKQGKQVVLVSSGAIGSGMQALGLKRRPKTLSGLQMAAAVGQGILMSRYQTLFAAHGIIVGQVLLTYDDLRDRKRHLNARNAMLGLLRERVIPIVNENDVVSVDEIKFGDNDVLGALVASLISAELLVLMSTTDGLQARAPSGKMARVPYLAKIDDQTLELVFSSRNELSTGGMKSKLLSAETARRAGALVAIVDGRTSAALRNLFAGKSVGTCIDAPALSEAGSAQRKKWIAFFQRAQGDVVVDDGARVALCEGNRSLLAIGIKSVEGRFDHGSLVNISSVKGQVLGRGLVEYSSDDLRKIVGKRSSEIETILGACQSAEVIHRDNMAIFHEANDEGR